MKKIISMAIVVVMMLAFASTALAWEKYDYRLGANSSTSAIHMRDITRGFSAWYGDGTHKGAKLTVRPRVGSQTASGAVTFSSSKQAGGQTYDFSPNLVDVWANTDGGDGSLTGHWKF